MMADLSVLRRSGLRRPGPFLLAAAVVLTAACEQAPPLPTVRGIPWELARIRHETIHDVRYRIALEIPRDRTDSITGRTTILFRWSDPKGRDVVLDFLRPEERVHVLKVNGDDVRWRAENDHVVIPAAAMHPNALNEVEIRYRAGDEALNRHDDFLYSLFVPDRAHFSLPVFDQPNLKGKVEWRVAAPGDWHVITNGPLEERSGTPERRTYRFKETRPLPTYLFAVAAGNFRMERAVVGGRTLVMYHRETDTAKVARNRDEIFRLHARALDWLEAYTGIAYPFQKFAFILIPSFQYGGMEHPGGILYRAAGLMLDESATQGQILGRASVIAHETSHMWFGDMVTMNWFDDVWTKEVFANFMAAKIVEPSFPDVDHRLRFLTAHFPAAYAVDRTAGANPIRQPLENLREAGTLYGAIIYQKAPIVMRHLEARVGAATFRDGLREYLKTFSYANATWPDLVGILDEQSPEDLAAWSHVWVDEPGRPTITVRRDGADVEIRQADPAEKGRVWPQRMGVRLGYASRDSLVAIDLGADPVLLKGVGAGGLRYVLPNGTGLEYGEFVLDRQSLAYLGEHLEELDSALVRGAAWVTLWDQVLDGRMDPGPFLDLLLKGARTEPDELALSLILSDLQTTFWRLLAPEERARRAPEVESVLWRGVVRAATRTAKASYFRAYRSVALSDAGVRRLKKLWAHEEKIPGLPLSERDETVLAEALALREAPGWRRILDAQGSRISNPDRKARFHFVRPSLDADPSVRRSFFESLRDPANRAREPWVLAGLANLHHPLRARASEPLVLPALEMLEEIQRTGDIFFPGRWVGAVLGGHNEPEVAETVRSFLAARPDYPPRLRAKILQAADMVERAARIVYAWQPEAER